METPTRSHTVPAVMIGLALIVSTGIASQSFLKAKRLNNTVSVAGSTERTVMSDRVKWSGTFARQVDVAGVKKGNDQLKKDIESAIDYLKKRGIPEADIAVQAPFSQVMCEGRGQPSYGYASDCMRVTGYALQQGFTVESTKVDEVAKIALDAPSDLSADGRVFTSNNLEYYYGKLGDLKLEMLEEATKNAKERADRIVRSTGSEIGVLQSASMGVFQVTAVNSTEVSDYGAYDTATKEKKVTAIVRTTFLLK